MMIAVLVVSFLLAEPTVPDILGDIDGDRRIDIADLAALRRSLDGVLSLPPMAMLRADVDQNGLVTEADYQELIFPALEIPTVPPFQTPPVGMPVIEALSSPFAAPGAAVAIDGWGFGINASTNEVTLGGTRATIVSATPRRIEFVVPDATGTLLVRNLTTGLTSLGASFIASASDHPAFDPQAGVGSVYFAGAPRVLVTNETFVVPIVVNAGTAKIGEVGFRVFFDPEKLEVLWLDNKLPSAFSALPPCIDNAAGVLGAGAIRLVEPGDDPAGDLRVAFEVTFKVLTEDDEPPDFVVRGETIGDGKFPSSDIGFDGPRFAVDTAQLFPEPKPRPMRRPLDAMPPKIMLTGDVVVVPLQEIFVPVDYGATPFTQYLAFANGLPCAVKAVEPGGVRIQIPVPVTSGPLVLFNPLNMVQASNDLTLIRMESVPPFIADMVPASGSANVDAAVTIHLAFSEVIRNEQLGGAVRLFVTEVGQAEVEVPAVRAFGLYKFSSVSMRPLFPFSPGAAVNVRIVAPVDDLSGNAMLPAPNLGFTIRS